MAVLMRFHCCVFCSPMTRYVVYSRGGAVDDHNFPPRSVWEEAAAAPREEETGDGEVSRARDYLEVLERGLCAPPRESASDDALVKAEVV